MHKNCDPGPSFAYIDIRRTPHPVIVTIRDKRD